MELAVLDKTGKDTGRKVELNTNVFGVEPSEHAVYLDVKQYLANQRQGTHKSKQRAEITGSTKKLKKQKGTGTARAGSIKSPLFKGGGRVFGPEPRDYSFKLNKKVKKVARKSILSAKLKENEILVVEDFALDTPKTKEFNAIINNLVQDSKSLLIVNDNSKNVFLSSRNLKKSKVATVSEMNTYDLANAGKVVLFEGVVAEIEKQLS